MDTHDISDTPQYLQHLQKQKQNLRDAQSRMGQRPPGGKPREQTIFQFRLRTMQNARHLDTTVGYVASSFVPSPYPPCVRPFGELTKTAIDDLVLETHHRGKYLMLRCVTPQDRMTAIMAIVEDEDGDVLLLQLYHQEQAAEPVEDILVEGRVLIVKEPYLKYTSDGGYGLRVDHLSDVELLSSDDGRIPQLWKQASRKKTAMAWKTIGNDDFKKAKYRTAIEAYGQVLRCSPTTEELHTVKLNRALAFLKIKSFDSAFLDIESVTTSNLTEKALFRKAQALYGLQRFRECCEVLKALRLAYPSNKSGKEELDRAIGRLAEQTHGRYQFKQLYAEAARLRPPHLDHATYTGPVVVKESGISPGGRGLFTTKAVAAGDLLVCEKAFAHAFIDESNGGYGGISMTILIDAMSDRATMGSEPELINMMIRKCHHNPSLATAITDLHHGTYEPVETSSVDGGPIVDSFLIRRIIALNSFGCPLTTRDFRLSMASKTSPGPSEAFHSSGIWPTASYINHSCTSNARRSFIGDMMIVRATCDLPPNTELRWWYQPPGMEPTSYLSHQKPLLKNWGFMCKCAICRDMRDTPESVMQKRRQLRSQFRGLIPTGQGLSFGGALGMDVLRKAEAVVDKLKATFKKPAAQVPRLAVTDLQLVLAREYENRMQPVETCRLALAALESFGFVVEGGELPRREGGGGPAVRGSGLMTDNVIDCWMFLRSAYRVAAPEFAAAAEGYAKTAYRICIGEDETFHETYGCLL